MPGSDDTSWSSLLRFYLRWSSRPFAALVVGLPLLLLYEIGGRWLGRTGAGGLVAERLLIELIASVGPLLTWTPALLWLGVVVFWHYHRRDRAKLVPWAPPMMLAESLFLTIPLLVLGQFGAGPLQGLGGAAPIGLGSALLGALGAGLYEELIFRCFLLLGLIWFLRTLGWQALPAGLAALLLSSLAFSSAHFAPAGSEAWDATRFTLRWIAGMYLGYLLLQRGLGIATCTHAWYDILIVLSLSRQG